MSHTVIIFSDSLLEFANPDRTEYASAREHFSAHELSRLNAYRTRPHPASFTIPERVEIAAALNKLVFLALNE